MDIVVSKFKEDVQWIENLSQHNIIIYNKDPEDTRWEHNLANYGKDAETHLYHIVNNYDNLAEHTAFLQGHPFDHWDNTIQDILTFDTSTDYRPLGIVYKRDNEHLIRQTVDYCKEVGINFKEPFYFIAGMQLILSRKQIYTRSREFYLKLKESIPKRISVDSSYEGNSYQIWSLEYSWPTVFNINEQIVSLSKNG